MNADAFRPIVVAYRNGAPVRLEQVANVIDSVENDHERARGSTPRTARQQRAITLQVHAAAGQQHHRGHRRGPRAAAGVRGAAAAVGAPDVRGRTARRTIREAFSDIQLTMLVTLVLVVGVIYLFLHNGRRR